jgi:peptidoglycan hydrolase-like protein with peptidoglycan-binding domain
MILKKVIITILSVLFLFAVISPAVSYAQTSNNQTLILQLQAQIAQLQSQLLLLQSQSKTTTQYKIPTAQECDSITFSKPLYQGLVDGDVLCLQKLLNKDPDTKLAVSGLGSPGNETIYFGVSTKQAVAKFQNKYGISLTGTIGPKTRTKLNSLINVSKTEEKQELEKDVEKIIEEQEKTLTITVTQSSNGLISPDTVSLIARGTKQTFTITPGAGYSVASVLVDGVSVGAVTSYTFSDITDNHKISATFTQNPVKTGRTFYNWVQMPDENKTIAYWNFRKIEMPRRYPFVKRFEVLFLNAHNIDTHYDDASNLELDMVAAKAQFDALNLTPGTYVGIDLEAIRTSTGELKWRDYNMETYEPNLAVINKKAEIITTIKSWRPDCYFAFYFFPDSNQYWNTLGSSTLDAKLDVIMEAAAPVINASDFISPDFYWYHKPDTASNYFTAERISAYVTEVIQRTKKHYPDKKIIPYVMWIYNSNLTTAQQSTSYNWPAEEISQITVSGSDWRVFLNALSDNGVNDVIGFISISIPWDNNAGWWVETLNWLGEPNNPVAMSKKQDLSILENQLASISAAIQNFINSLKK